MKRLKFEIDTEGAKLKMVTSLLWKSKGVVNTGLVTNVDTDYFYEALIAWKSRLQRNVTLSSTEGEYVGLSEISTKILFVRDIYFLWGFRLNTLSL